MHGVKKVLNFSYINISIGFWVFIHNDTFSSGIQLNETLQIIFL